MGKLYIHSTLYDDMDPAVRTEFGRRIEATKVDTPSRVPFRSTATTTGISAGISTRLGADMRYSSIRKSDRDLIYSFIRRLDEQGTFAGHVAALPQAPDGQRPAVAATAKLLMAQFVHPEWTTPVFLNEEQLDRFNLKACGDGIVVRSDITESGLEQLWNLDDTDLRTMNAGLYAACAKRVPASVTGESAPRLTVFQEALRLIADTDKATASLRRSFDNEAKLIQDWTLLVSLLLIQSAVPGGLSSEHEAALMPGRDACSDLRCRLLDSGSMLIDHAAKVLESAAKSVEDYLIDNQNPGPSIQDILSCHYSLRYQPDIQAASIDSLQATIEPWRRLLGQNIHLISHSTQLPEREQEARDLLERVENGTSKWSPVGWYNSRTDDVYLYAPCCTTDRVDELILHEVVAHKGLPAMLGKANFDRLCDLVWQTAMDERTRGDKLMYVARQLPQYRKLFGPKQTFAELPEQVRLSLLGDAGLRRSAANEHIADLAQKGVTQTTWQMGTARYIEAVKSVFNDTGVNIKIEERDLARLLSASMARLTYNASHPQGHSESFGREVHYMAEPLSEPVEQPAPGQDITGFSEAVKLFDHYAHSDRLNAVMDGLFPFEMVREMDIRQDSTLDTVLSPLSLMPFTIGGMGYNSVEQYIQYQRALLSGKQSLCDDIILSDPEECRKAGRKIAFSTSVLWEQKAAEVTDIAVKAMLKANPDAVSALAESGSARLLYFDKDFPVNEQYVNALMRVRDRLFEQKDWQDCRKHNVITCRWSTPAGGGDLAEMIGGRGVDFIDAGTSDRIILPARRNECIELYRRSSVYGTLSSLLETHYRRQGAERYDQLLKGVDHSDEPARPLSEVIPDWDNFVRASEERRQEKFASELLQSYRIAVAGTDSGHLDNSLASLLESRWPDMSLHEKASLYQEFTVQELERWWSSLDDATKSDIASRSFNLSSSAAFLQQEISELRKEEVSKNVINPQSIHEQIEAKSAILQALLQGTAAGADYCYDHLRTADRLDCFVRNAPSGSFLSSHPSADSILSRGVSQEKSEKTLQAFLGYLSEHRADAVQMLHAYAAQHKAAAGEVAGLAASQAERTAMTSYLRRTFGDNLDNWSDLLQMNGNELRGLLRERAREAKLFQLQQALQRADGSLDSEQTRVRSAAELDRVGEDSMRFSRINRDTYNTDNLISLWLALSDDTQHSLLEHYHEKALAQSEQTRLEYKLRQDEVARRLEPDACCVCSGGARGSDEYWGYRAAGYGIPTRHFYTGERSEKNAPSGNEEISAEDFNEGRLEAAAAARRNFGYPYDAVKNGLLIRDWSQVKHSDAVFAVGMIVQPGERIFPGIPGDTRTALAPSVAGGTGYAVGMAILHDKPVFVFDQDIRLWYQYDKSTDSFVRVDMKKDNRGVERQVLPTHFLNIAGIGTRNLNSAGKLAIADYMRDFARAHHHEALQKSLSGYEKAVAEVESWWQGLSDNAKLDLYPFSRGNEVSLYNDILKREHFPSVVSLPFRNTPEGVSAVNDYAAAVHGRAYMESIAAGSPIKPEEQLSHLDIEKGLSRAADTLAPLLSLGYGIAQRGEEELRDDGERTVAPETPDEEVIDAVARNLHAAHAKRLMADGWLYGSRLTIAQATETIRRKDEDGVIREYSQFAGRRYDSTLTFYDLLSLQERERFIRQAGQLMDTIHEAGFYVTGSGQTQSLKPSIPDIPGELRAANMEEAERWWSRLDEDSRFAAFRAAGNSLSADKHTVAESKPTPADSPHAEAALIQRDIDSYASQKDLIIAKREMVVDRQTGQERLEYTNEASARLARQLGGVNTLMMPGEHHFGNPFTPVESLASQYGNIKVASCKEAVEAFSAWLHGTAHQNVQTKRRDWIIEQVRSGALDDKPLIYYTNKALDDSFGTRFYSREFAPNHAHVLQDFIREHIAERQREERENYYLSSTKQEEHPLIEEQQRPQAGKLFIEEIGLLTPDELRSKYGKVRTIDITDATSSINGRYLNPLYPHKGIPVYNSAPLTAASVEGIWEALKSLKEDPAVSESTLDNATMKGIRREGELLGFHKGVYSKELISGDEAYERIFLPAYRWMLDNSFGGKKAIEEIRKQLDAGYNVVILSDDQRVAPLVKAYVEGRYPALLEERSQIHDFHAVGSPTEGYQLVRDGEGLYNHFDLTSGLITDTRWSQKAEPVSLGMTAFEAAPDDERVQGGKARYNIKTPEGELLSPDEWFIHAEGFRGDTAKVVREGIDGNPIPWAISRDGTLTRFTAQTLAEWQSRSPQSPDSYIDEPEQYETQISWRQHRPRISKDGSQMVGTTQLRVTDEKKTLTEEQKALKEIDDAKKRMRRTNKLRTH